VTRTARWIGLAVVGLALSACGAKNDTGTPFPPATPVPAPADTTSASPSPSSSALPNACPAEGCRASIVSVTKAANGELIVTLTSNFTPDISHNHFHIYWDTYTSRQVSDDAQPRFNVTQGDWVPTDANPYTTGDETSVTKRGSSTHLCVTAGDRNHDVLNPDLYQCYDVGPEL
jgi:hypothetical protein